MYVILAAVCAGCMLANHLSQDPAVRVAIMEAAGKDNYWFHIPVGHHRQSARRRVLYSPTIMIAEKGM